MHALFLPGIGASHRNFPEYGLIFERLEIVRYKGCITLKDHLNKIDTYVDRLEAQQQPYVLIGHSLGANLIYHYITHRQLNYIQGYSMIGGGPRFQPLSSWNTIFSLPKFVIVATLFFIILGAPLLFVVYGWNGMFQRVNVVDLFLREGIDNIRNIYNQTLVPLLDDPEPDRSAIPAQIIRLPNDLLFPQYAMDETRELVPKIEEVIINRELIHFSHHLDILVAAHIHSWLREEEIAEVDDLPFDMQYALSNPKSISVEMEGFALPRLPVIIILLIVILNGIRINFPRSPIVIVVTDILETVLNTLKIDQIPPYLFGLVMISILISLLGYYWLIEPKFPDEKQTKLRNYPFVSIIVPMRNEERNIGTCLTSLLHLQYPNYEIILVDGRSEDETIPVAQQTLKKHNTLDIEVKIINEPSLPPDWIGKSWACWTGVSQAKGEYFLFTDADTRHQPDSLRATMRVIQDRNLVGTSAIGKLETGSFWEHAILPFFKTLLFILFGGRFANRSGRTLAIGQYILVDQTTYQEIGGHKKIKAEIAEDIHLAENIAAYGKFEAYNANELYSVRMYQSLKEIRLGLERNAAESVGDNTFIAFIASVGLILWRLAPLPFYFVILPLLQDQIISLLLLSYVVFTTGLFYIDTVINNNSWYYALITPIGIVALVSFLISASFKKLDKKPKVWKGREYMT